MYVKLPRYCVLVLYKAHNTVKAANPKREESDKQQWGKLTGKLIALSVSGFCYLLVLFVMILVDLIVLVDTWHCKGALGRWKVDFDTKEPLLFWYTIMLEGLEQSPNMVVYLSIIFGKSFIIVVYRFCNFCPNHSSLYLTVYIWWGNIIFESKKCTTGWDGRCHFMGWDGCIREKI